MKRLIEFPLESGGTIVVETDEPVAGGVGRAGRDGEIAEKAANTFESTLDRLQPLTGALIDRLQDLARQPDQIEVQFGVKLSGSLGAIIASASGEANYSVKLTWKRASGDAG
jgi:hypothetical protein